MMKTIVVHIGPDLDAITSAWIVKTFWEGWEEANIAFVPAGTTLNKMSPDSDPDIIHTDTGFGKYDHHQTDADICASMLVYEEAKRQHGPDPALERIVAVVNDVDHFREVFFPNPTADFWDLGMIAQIDGWRLLYADNPMKIMELGFLSLDAIYKVMLNKIWAEKEIVSNGIPFSTKWGKGLGIATVNDEVIHQAQKQGYVVAVRKDPKKGYLRIKSLPKDDIDLTPLYEQLKKDEPGATWFLHASRHMILNGSAKNPDMKPSQKSLEEIVEVIKTVCN
jgi:hypothetical protein